MVKNILSATIFIVIALFVLYNTVYEKILIDKKYIVNHSSRIMTDFVKSLEYYCTSYEGVPVVYSDLTLMVDELVSVNQSSSIKDSWFPYDSLKQIREGKDLNGVKYSYSVDATEGKVLLTSSLKGWHYPEEEYRNTQRYAAINFFEVELLDEKITEHHKQSPYLVLNFTEWQKDSWNSVYESNNTDSSFGINSKIKFNITNKLSHFLLNSETDFAISTCEIILTNDDKPLYIKPQNNIEFKLWCQSPNKRYLCVIGSSYTSPFQGQLVLYDLANSSLVINDIISCAQALTDIDFSINSKSVYITGKGVFVYNTETGEHITTIGDKWCLATSLNLDEKYIATGMAIFGQIQIFELQTGKLAHSFRTDHKYIRNIEFSPDSKYLATWESEEPDAEVKIWLLDYQQ